MARCTVGLMRDLGLSGVRRGKTYKVTTRSDLRQHRPADWSIATSPLLRPTSSGLPTSPT